MRPSRRILTIAAAILILITTLSAAIPRAFNPHQAAAGAPPVAFLIDCDTTTPGVQSNCTYPSGTTTLDVDVILQNNGPDLQMAAFQFTLVSSPREVFQPLVASCSGLGLDCNPDLNTSLPGSWECPLGDLDADTDADGKPGTAQSSILCYVPLLGPALPLGAGSITRLATVKFVVNGESVASFGLQDTGLYDLTYDELGTCEPSLVIPAFCGTATVQVGESANTSTPTNTLTPTFTPTATPLLSPTPTPFRYNAVTGIVALNEAICIAGAAIQGVPATTAAFSCQGISQQSQLQTFVDCLVVSGFCPRMPGFNEIFRRPRPTDFASIDLDGDSIQQGQPLEVIAFVGGDYPVHFETNLGTFLTPQGSEAGQNLTCAPGSPQYPGNSLDPDCDGDLTTVGDGVVAVRLIVPPDDPRGIGTVTVTQNNIAKQLVFNVTGGAKTISFESLDGRTEIETGADTCSPVLDGVPSGSTSPKKTHVFARALDDQGTPVVGALITWDHVFARSSQAPEGGTALPQLPTWMFDGKGAGAVLVACGGETPGTLSIGAKFDRILAPYSDPDYTTTFAIPVVSPPSPTPTPEETTTPTATASATATATPGGPRLSLQVTDSGIEPGTSFGVTLYGELLPGLGAYEVEVQFDPAVLAFEGAGDLGFLGSTGRAVFCPSPLVDSGNVRWGCASTSNAPGPSGEGELAVFVFTALVPGETTVTLARGELCDELCDTTYEPSLVTTTFTIAESQGEATATPTTTTTPEAEPSGVPTTTPSATTTRTSSPTTTPVPLTPTPSTTPTTQPSVVTTTTPQHTTTVIASTRTVVATTRTVEPETTPSTTNTPEHTSTPVPTSTSTQQPTAVPTTTATATTVPLTPTTTATSTATVESTATTTTTTTRTVTATPTLATATTTAVATTTSTPRPHTATPRATTTRLAATSSPAVAPTRSVQATQTADRNSSVLGTSHGPTGIVLPDTGSGGAKGNNPQTPIGLAAAIAALFLTTALIALRHPK